MYYLYRYLVYQSNTKAFDREFQVEVTEDNVDYFINIFNNLRYLEYLIRSKSFLEHQDMIQWHYILTEKTFNMTQEPYLIVAHKDDGTQNINVFPRYYKNTYNLKILPNLHDLANLDLLTNKLGNSPYSKKPLYRNCLKKVLIEPLAVPNNLTLDIVF